MLQYKISIWHRVPFERPPRIEFLQPAFSTRRPSKTSTNPTRAFSRRYKNNGKMYSSSPRTPAERKRTFISAYSRTGSSCPSSLVLAVASRHPGKIENKKVNWRCACIDYRLAWSSSGDSTARAALLVTLIPSLCTGTFTGERPAASCIAAVELVRDEFPFATRIG